MPRFGANSTPGPVSRIRVLLPLPLKGAYDYRVPDGLALAPGDFVRVPLGGSERVGVVWGEGGGEVAEDKLRDVARKLPAPPMPEATRRLIDWVASYTLSSPGAVLRMGMSVPEALEPPKPQTGWRLTASGSRALLAVQAAEQGRADGAGELPFRMTAARAAVIGRAASGAPRTAAELARAAGVSTAVVKGLAQAGALEPVDIVPEPDLPVPDPDAAGPTLSAAQRAAADDLVARVGGGFSVALLDGVTGSGKTEVYHEAVAAALRAGRQVLVLLPEIALGAQSLERFAARFGAPPVPWHSDLTRAERRDTWRAVADGRARVVVGARSALFLPFRELGLVVVDEEHEGSYKQEDGVLYHARDMAVVRGSLAGFPVVLVSATPSLETVVNVERGRYDRLHLPERHGGASLPEVRLIDMRADPPERGQWLSPRLADALAQTFAAGEQAMLFLNRRGYAPLTLCRKCGHRMECPQCSAWLVEHRLAGRLECHHCGFALPMPEACPECGTEGPMVACGPGIERVAEEAAARFPDARVALMASDTIHGPAAAAEIVRRVRDHEIDLLVGTQIMAKGHHFPRLTLVGVVDADLGLAGGDLRAGERTFQLLHQVAGRAGREQRPGTAWLQTYMPEHPVMAALAAGDRDRFQAAERAAREAAGMPPFGRLAAVIVSGRDARQVDRVANALGRHAPRGEDVEAWGPAPAPLATLRGHHRRRLLLKTTRTVNIQKLARAWLASVERTGPVRIKVDIDPYSFL